MDIGAQLRTSREAKGLSLETLAHTTRVQPRILAAIERNDLSAIPPRPSGRSFVRAYAREVDLDPERTARDYFARFTTAPEPAPVEPVTQTAPSVVSDERPFGGSRWAPAAAALIVLLSIVAVAVLSSRARDKRVEPDAVGTSGGSTAAAHPDGAPAVAAATSTPAPPAPDPTLTIVLTATRGCWVTAQADGKRVVYRIMQPGSRETLRASEVIRIRAGDAGALSWTVNGREMGTFGDVGEIRNVEITPQNALRIR